MLNAYCTFRVSPEGMSGSGLLAYHVANDVIVSITNWYTFMCANDVARYFCTGEPLAH